MEQLLTVKDLTPEELEILRVLRKQDWQEFFCVYCGGLQSKQGA